MNKCPKQIKKGHCDECEKRKLKKCERCSSKEEVKSSIYSELNVEGCFCYNCRMNFATWLSLTRSY